MYENLSYSQFLSFGMFLVGHHCHLSFRPTSTCQEHTLNIFSTYRRFYAKNQPVQLLDWIETDVAPNWWRILALELI
uniref:Secreted protein n=1 Tax=Haemonchus contortus TaxID=6289 RepID=A0A7I4YXJ5_HAECO